MNRVVEILCRRDGISYTQAVARVQEVQRIIADSSYDYDSAEEIMMEELGLEMDYLLDLI